MILIDTFKLLLMSTWKLQFRTFCVTHDHICLSNSRILWCMVFFKFLLLFLCLEGSGNILSENFIPGWFLMESHSETE